MTRLLRSLLLTLFLPPLLALALAAGLLAFAHTDSGRRLVAWAVAEASGGQVRIAGLAGRLPWAPRLARLEVADRDGTWLAVRGAALDLDPWALLSGELRIERLAALGVDLDRLPAGGGAGDLDLAALLAALPVRAEIRQLAVAALRIPAAGLGAPPLALAGRGAVGPAGFALAIQADALGRGDRYRLALGLALAPDRGQAPATAGGDGALWQLDLGIEERPDGWLRGLLDARLPPNAKALAPFADAWRLAAAAQGPADRLALGAAWDAGSVTAIARGHLDLAGRSADGLRIGVSTGPLTLAPAPAAPARPALAWQRVQAIAELTGPLGAPRGSVALEADGLAAGDLTLGRLSARLAGSPERLTLVADLAAPAAPGLPPGLLGPAVGLELTARQTGTGWEIPAARLAGSGLTAGVRGHIGPGAPALAWDLELRALDGLAPGWPGRAAAHGSLTGPWDALALASAIELRLDLVPGLPHTGPVRFSGRLEADLAPPAGTLALVGDWADQPLAIALSGRSADTGGWALTLAELRLPGLSASGELRGAPPAAPAAPPASGSRAGTPAQASRTPRLPVGELRLHSEDLGRLAPLADALTGRSAALAGRLAAALTLAPAGEERLTATGEDLGIGTGERGAGDLRIGTLALSARVADPLGAAGTAGTLKLAGLAAGPLTGDLTLHTAGPARDLELAAEAALAVADTPVALRLAARLRATERRLGLSELVARGRGARIALAGPAVLDLRDGLASDRLRLALVAEPAPASGSPREAGTLELAGRLLPAPDLRARLADLSLDLLGSALGLPLAGTLAGDAELRGPWDAPLGRLAAEAQDIRVTQGAARALPPARLGLAARLEADRADLDARLEAGPRTRLTLVGRIADRQGGPLAPSGLGAAARAQARGSASPAPTRPAPRLDLRAAGRADLALLNPLLTAQGRRTGGAATLDARVTGPLDAPRLAGSLGLAEAALHDSGLGLSVTDIAGTLRLDGERLASEGLSGRAGRGRVTLAGTLGVLAPGMPADLRLSARSARLVQLDLLEADGDLELRLQGPLTPARPAAPAAPAGGAGPRLAGRVDLTRVALRIPERLPAGVATLKVRERGQRRRPVAAPARPAPPLSIALDLTVAAPRAVQVTGRGLDAELGGQVQVRGTLTEPDLAGALDLRRGDFDLAGHRLSFTRGRLGFEGGGRGGGLDPSLDFEARASAAGATAILAVQGSVQSPRIELSGEPELPEDEVLSRLLFGTAAGRLSGLQAARLGLAAAELAGVRGLAGIGEGRLLGRAREGLGLDRLTLESDEQGGAVLEGGRQLFQGFYLGARQGQRAGETQGVLRMEITPELKLEADVGAGGGTRAGAAFQLDY